MIALGGERLRGRVVWWYKSNAEEREPLPMHRATYEQVELYARHESGLPARVPHDWSGSRAARCMRASETQGA